MIIRKGYNESEKNIHQIVAVSLQKAIKEDLTFRSHSLENEPFVISSISSNERTSDSTIVKSANGTWKMKKDSNVDVETRVKKSFYLAVSLAFPINIDTLRNSFSRSIDSTGVKGLFVMTIITWKGDTLRCPTKTALDNSFYYDHFKVKTEECNHVFLDAHYNPFYIIATIESKCWMWIFVSLCCCIIISVLISKNYFSKGQLHKGKVKSNFPNADALTDWIELSNGLFFSKKYGRLKKREVEVSLTGNLLSLFTLFLDKQDHFLTQKEICIRILSRKTTDISSSDQGAVFSTIKRLRMAITQFEELKIITTATVGYQLVIT